MTTGSLKSGASPFQRFSLPCCWDCNHQAERGDGKQSKRKSQTTTQLLQGDCSVSLGLTPSNMPTTVMQALLASAHAPNSRMSWTKPGHSLPFPQRGSIQHRTGRRLLSCWSCRMLQRSSRTGLSAEGSWAHILLANRTVQAFSTGRFCLKNTPPNKNLLQISGCTTFMFLFLNLKG